MSGDMRTIHEELDAFIKAQDKFHWPDQRSARNPQEVAAFGEGWLACLKSLFEYEASKETTE